MPVRTDRIGFIGSEGSAMITALIAILTAIFPSCATEDSSMCLWQNGDVLHVNLAPADPAPEHIAFTVNY